MNEIHWGVVILHYKTMKCTQHCVELLLAKKQNISIAVVDNGSKDGSGEKLAQYYKDKTQVKVIISQTNEGFARGNNLGYVYLKKLGCDFIILLNNDAYIEQENFFELLYKEYENSGFAVCGPQILNEQHEVIEKYPQKAVHSTVFSTYIGQIMCIIKIILTFFNIDLRLADIISNRQQLGQGEYCRQRHENVQISGCCIIFSPEYINLFDGINKETFLYLEEEIILVRVRGSGLKIVYNPEITVTHIGEASTKKQISDDRKRRRFRYAHQLHSFRALRKEIIKYR